MQIRFAFSEKKEQLARRIAEMAHYLQKKRNEFFLSSHLLHCGSRVKESLDAIESSAAGGDVGDRLSIAANGCAETHYWLVLIHDNTYISDADFGQLAEVCESLLSILKAFQQNTLSGTTPAGANAKPPTKAQSPEA